MPIDFAVSAFVMVALCIGLVNVWYEFEREHWPYGSLDEDNATW